jgi:hypothetical protein
VLHRRWGQFVGIALLICVFYGVAVPVLLLALLLLLLLLLLQNLRFLLMPPHVQ